MHVGDRGRGRCPRAPRALRFARFADSTVHQPTLVEDESVTIRVVRDGRIGSVGTNRTDEEGLREAARRAERPPKRAARSGLPRSRSSRPAARRRRLDEETAALAPDELAARAWSAIESCPIRPLRLLHKRDDELAVASSDGLAVSQH